MQFREALFIVCLMRLNFEEMEGKKKIILKEGFDFRM